MYDEKFAEAEDKLATWETPALTKLDAGDAEAAAGLGTDAGLLAS